MAAALMTEQLEPSGLGHDLLREWAPWARDDNEGRASWSVKPRVDPAYWGDPPERWYIVNRIVSKLLASNSDFRRVVKRYYLGGYEPWEIARKLGWSEVRVRTVLCVCCGLVEREYRDWTRA